MSDDEDDDDYDDPLLSNGGWLGPGRLSAVADCSTAAGACACACHAPASCASAGLATDKESVATNKTHEHMGGSASSSDDDVEPLFAYAAGAAPQRSTAAVSATPLQGMLKTLAGDSRPPEARSYRSSCAGHYSREGGVGCRQGWQERALAHLDAVRVGGSFYTAGHCDIKSKYIFLRGCPTNGCCIEHIKPRDVLECLATTYGEPPAKISGEEPWPSRRNHAAGDVWFDLMSRSFVDNEFIFSIRGTRVCAEVWRAAYDIPRSTFEGIGAAVVRGDATWRVDAKVNVLMAGAARADEANCVNRATVWWMSRLKCYEAMPHQRGTINADHCVWQTVFEDEYMIECEIAGVSSGCISTWKEGKARALKQLADQTYGSELGGRPCVLKMRSKHSAFKECSICQDLRLKLKNALGLEAAPES